MFENLTLSLQARYRIQEKEWSYLLGAQTYLKGLELFGAYDTADEEFALGLRIHFPHLGLGHALTGQALRSSKGRSKDGVLNNLIFTLRSEYFRKAFVVQKRFAEIEISGHYEDEASGFVLLGTRARSAQHLIETMEKARRDRDIQGVILKIGPLSGAFIGDVSALHQEIRRAIQRVREAGKPVIAYVQGDMISTQQLYLASVADSIVIPEVCLIKGLGTAVEIDRMKRTFEKLGVEWDAYTAGKYKSSFHEYYTDTSTVEQREAIQSLVETAYDELIQTLAEDRRIPLDTLKQVADGRPFKAQEALRLGLITHLGWYQKALDVAAARVGKKQVSRFKRLGKRRYWKIRWAPPPTVAVVTAYGTILTGKSRRDPLMGFRIMGSETVVEQLRQASRAPGVRALVFRVDSGGGSGVASDEILQEIRRIKKEKKLPVIVSMGNVAASGGYWISSLADTIVASPLTVTGSIGVVMAKPVIEQLYQKLGITHEVFKVGEHADAFSLARHLSPEEMEKARQYIDDFYQLFLDRVSEGRKMPREKVHEVGQGRVWMGQQAKEIGLVDCLGGLKEAIQIAARKAGIDKDYRVTYFRGPKRGWLSYLFGSGLWVKWIPFVGAILSGVE